MALRPAKWLVGASSAWRGYVQAPRLHGLRSASPVDLLAPQLWLLLAETSSRHHVVGVGGRVLEAGNGSGTSSDFSIQTYSTHCPSIHRLTCHSLFRYFLLFAFHLSHEFPLFVPSIPAHCSLVSLAGVSLRPNSSNPAWLGPPSLNSIKFPPRYPILIFKSKQIIHRQPLRHVRPVSLTSWHFSVHACRQP